MLSDYNYDYMAYGRTDAYGDVDVGVKQFSPQPTDWTDANGRTVPIQHMGTSHLINVAAFLYRCVAHRVMGVPMVMKDGSLFTPSLSVEIMRAKYAHVVAELNRRKNSRAAS